MISSLYALAKTGFSNVQRTQSGLFTRLVSVAVVAIGLLCSPVQASLFEDRATYKAAIGALQSNRITQFDGLVTQLQDYPLLPYLQYRRDLKSISRASTEVALAKREEYAPYTFGDRYMTEWLAVQFRKGNYQTYVEQYVYSEDVVAQCRYADALIKIGRRAEAFDLLPALWSVGKSQDESCDPAFTPWIRAGEISDELAFERLQKTLDARSYSLSRYLFRFMSNAAQRSAQSMYDARRNPNLVRSGSRFSDDRWGNEALIYGLTRLARNDASRARQLWQNYRESRSFTDEQKHRLDDELYLWFALDGQAGLPFQEGLSVRTLTRVIHTAISHRLWEDAHRWILSLPETELEKSEWRYWQARVLHALGEEGWQEQLEALAKVRTYYGFLAAAYIGTEPQLNEFTYTRNLQIEDKLSQDSHAQMVIEFFAIGENNNGRREWRHLQKSMPEEEQQVMVYWFNENGLSEEAIFAANRGALTHFLEVRFPKPFLSYFKHGAFVADVPLEFLLAVSRQESAFNHRAISSAGARGLMQMMLATARATARSHGLRRPSHESLLDPRANIELGSHHVAELYQEFDRNRILVAMSYNAGKHNTYEWIRRYGVNDVTSFIEIIPYGETREYVKGVLAFSLVYALREGKTVPLIHSHELEINLAAFN